MKLEKRFQRLAEKCGAPELVPILMGEAPASALPDRCMVWTGAVKGQSEKSRIRVMRRTPAVVRDRPYGVILWDKHRVAVHRLLYQLILKPDFVYKMENLCNTQLCVNPAHWKVHQIAGAPPSQLEPEDEPWTVELAERQLEDAFTFRNPTTREALLNDPYVIDIPPDILRQALIRIRKEHLLDC